ncbi:MAG: lysoplasmalogenase [Thermoanaerobaculales bacterium]|nr:lysoplasmalogenase [Thermoanaerobaculales bacterium]
MITNLVLASVLAGAVVSLLHAIRVEDRTLEVISKTAASVTFVALGWVRWSAGDIVGGWLLAGLAFCALGDLLLLGKRTFDPGLLAFLLGHVLYILGFRAALPISGWPLVAALPLVVAAIAAIRWMWPHLGHRRSTVTFYIVVISIMVWGGLSTWWLGALPWTAAVGALLFYLSDLAVARHRFVHPAFINRAIGLPLYYAGQLLIALTIRT